MITLYCADIAEPRVHGHVRDLRPRWLLQEMRINHRIEAVQWRSDEQTTTAYRAIHPLSKVPALVDRDLQLTESSAILLYLAERFADRGFWPATIQERAKLHEQMYFAMTMIEPLALSWYADGAFRAGQPGVEEARRDAEARLAPALAWVELGLATRPYAVGASFGVADIVLTCVLRYLEGAPFLGPCSQRYIDRTTSRETFRRVCEKNGRAVTEVVLFEHDEV